MAMPALTAETTLYRSRDHYKLVAPYLDSAVPTAVLPQQFSCVRDCWQDRSECRADCRSGVLGWWCRRRCDGRFIRCARGCL